VSHVGEGEKEEGVGQQEKRPKRVWKIEILFPIFLI
jgi:hypothetical protein